MVQIHSAAAVGFETAADAYARGRPDYPAALDLWLRTALRLEPGKRVLDLGAGTGKFTPRLIATGAEVLAVEPVDSMRNHLARDLPLITTLPGTAESIPLPDASVDAVVCAQAFHWFATEAALDEIARILRPGGVLGLVWNLRDLSVRLIRRLGEIIDPYAGDAPRFHTGAWRRAFPHPAFGALHESGFPHEHTGPVEQVIVERLLSVSFIASQPEAEQARIADAIRAAVAADPDFAGKPVVSLTYRTLAFAAERL